MSSYLRPKLLEETIVLKQGEKILFLVPSKPDWFVTNKNGAIALSLCDGNRSMDDIQNALAAHPNSQEATLLIRNLLEAGFFETNPKCKAQKPASLLRSVHLNVSKSCNLKCNYCYAEARPTNIGSTLSLDEYRSLIDDLATINQSIEVAITGGEPLLNVFACDIAEYCRLKGIYTHLLTNATTINKENCTRITSAFNEVRVSVDGYYPETHDYHRGTGSFEKTSMAIEWLQKAGAKIRIAMTVTKKNISEVELMAERYRNSLIFQPLFNAGNARNNETLAISGEEYFYALKNAKGVEPMSQIGQSLLRLRNRGTTKCAIGDAEISIAHNGDVYPCHMLHLPEYYSGNIREQSVCDIYRNSNVLTYTRELSVHNMENCGSCAVRLLCGGSCRARALYLSGRLDVADCFCEYEFLAFTEGLLRSVDLVSTNDIACLNCDYGFALGIHG